MKDQEILLVVARIITIVIGASAIVLALWFESVVDLVIFAAGFWAPMILVPLVAALFNIVVSRKVIVITSIGGIASFLGWEHYMSDASLKGVFVGTMVSLVFFLIAKKKRVELAV